MRFGTKYITPLLAAGATAAVIAAAPTAFAANQQSCVSSGSATQCQAPGNVQIDTSPSTQSASASSPIGTSYGPFFYYSR
jgi:hypothetical protein